MSNRSMEGAGSQNSKKNQEVTRWEIVKPTDYEHFELHSKLIDTLTLTVNAKVDQIKKYALLQQQGLSSENHMALEESPALGKSQMVTSVVIGDIAVSFECPQLFTENNVDMDLAASCYRDFLERDGVVNSMKPLQFSFRERLQNWNIQCRMRPHGRLDMFYRYPRGRRSFRSVNEVIDFILYEICPDTHKQVQANNEGEAAAEKTKKRRRSSIYRGGRRRKKHRKTKGKAEQKADEEEAATQEADGQDAQKEQNTNPSSPPEPQKQASADTDLLNISDDLNAYESLFDEYFDEF